MSDVVEDLTTIEGFIAFQARMSKERISTCARKNNDYADPGDHEEDAFKVFRNFMAVERLGICSAETGLLVRLSDKFMRLANLVRPGHERQVKDESMLDTAQDLQNYVDLLAGLVMLKKKLGAPEGRET
jgi:hypothetical protein